MNQSVEIRALKVADYMIRENSTVRKTAKNFGISKSTVHKDISERLKKIDMNMYKMAKRVTENNKANKHIRGGQATKIKYSKK